MEKRHSTNDGASSSGAMTLPRSVGGNEYDTHDNIHTNSLDKRAYAQNTTNYGSKYAIFQLNILICVIFVQKLFINSSHSS